MTTITQAGDYRLDASVTPVRDNQFAVAFKSQQDNTKHPKEWRNVLTVIVEKPGLSELSRVITEALRNEAA